MKNLKFNFIPELINIKIIKKYSVLSCSEYPKNNPICHEEHLKWKYLNNPEGLSSAINGYQGDKLIGRISYQNKKFFFKNQIIKGANLCDLLIHKNYRNLENFLKLTTPFFINNNIPDRHISIMIPNEVSSKIYKKLLNLQPTGSLECRIFPMIYSIIFKKFKIKFPTFLNKFFLRLLIFLNKNFQYISKTTFSGNSVKNEEYKKMIKIYYQDNLIQGDRSKRWLDWRYNKKSTIKYSVKYIFLGDELIGYFAYRETKKYGLKLLLIMEIVIIKKNIFIESAILLNLIFSAHKLNCDLILSLRSIQKNNPLSNFLFPRIPNFLFPIPIELFVLNSEETLPQIFDIKNWKINMADFDIF